MWSLLESTHIAVLWSNMQYEERTMPELGCKIKTNWVSCVFVHFCGKIQQLSPGKNVKDHAIIKHFSFYLEPRKKKKGANKKIQNKNHVLVEQ